MHDGSWNNGMSDNGWWWLSMIVMMIAFWGGLIWIGTTLLRRSHTHLGPPTAPPAASSPKPTAQEILAERLARGEIEPDEYRQRLEALLTPPRT